MGLSLFDLFLAINWNPNPDRDANGCFLVRHEPPLGLWACFVSASANATKPATTMPALRETKSEYVVVLPGISRPLGRHNSRVVRLGSALSTFLVQRLPVTLPPPP